MKKLDIQEGNKKMNKDIESQRTECEVYSRVVGYLRPVRQWNRGKQQEFEDRKTFKMTSEKELVVTVKK